MAQRRSKQSYDNDDDIDYKNGSNQSGFKQQYVTVYKTVNHIGVLNAPLVIGPQINNYNQPSVQQPFFNQNLYEKDTKQNNLQRCLEDRSSIEFNQIKSIADKISTNELPKLCQNLNIPENRIESWLSKNKEYSPAYRMLFYWMQKDDLEATNSRLAQALSDCEQYEALEALSSKIIAQKS